MRKLRTKNLWPADEWPLAIKGSSTTSSLDDDRLIPIPIAKRLRFKTQKGETRLKFKDGRLDSQTLRRIRELTPESATLLEKILQSPLKSKPAGKESKSTRQDLSAAEGTPFEQLSSRPTRSARLREDKIRQILEQNGSLVCEVPGCGFDFKRTYGELGRNYAHVHHKNPLALRGNVETTLDDLAIVCANCHAMIHRGGKCRSLDELVFFSAGGNQR
ncbi:MAG: HNH endonuclease [Phycisphaerales bacterium]